MQNKQVFLQKHKKVIVLLAREAGTLGCGSTRLRGCHAANKNQLNKHTYIHAQLQLKQKHTMSLQLKDNHMLN